MSEQVWNLCEQMQGEIAREIRVMLGEEAYNEAIFTEEIRAGRVRAMQTLAADPSMSEEKRHEAWSLQYLQDGWVYGPQYSKDLKTHPNLLPWDKLPPSVRTKANIFAIVAKYAAKLAEPPSDGEDFPADEDIVEPGPIAKAKAKARK